MGVVEAEWADWIKTKALTRSSEAAAATQVQDHNGGPRLAKRGLGLASVPARTTMRDLGSV